MRHQPKHRPRGPYLVDRPSPAELCELLDEPGMPDLVDLADPHWNAPVRGWEAAVASSPLTGPASSPRTAPAASPTTGGVGRAAP
jgi:hypothetical protein